ncbi:hypothetical protein [Lederbergia citri]|uniref:DUF4386 family protein n=1 Tax=Lederbergia citri TaxID=2833580 RepID=A0A942YIF5_9BACI|nr:hypothetical protein [Lederbergia citri]MBS4196415.1 hypothetical protein [Lederbergia citri]
MTFTKAVRVFSVFGILGFLFTIAHFILVVSTGGADSIILNYLDITAWIFIMFGMIAAYFSRIEDLGKLGFIGIIITLFAIAWTIGIVSVHSFSFPIIHELSSSMDLANVAENALPSPIREAEITSSILMFAGPALFGLSVFLYNKLTRWPGVLLILAGVSSVLDSYVDILGLIAYLGTPVAIFWLCIKALKIDDSASSPSNS